MDEQIAIALAFAKDQKRKVLNTRNKRKQAQNRQDEFKMIDQYQSTSIPSSSRATKIDSRQHAPLSNSISNQEYYEKELTIICDDAHYDVNNSLNDVRLEYDQPDIENTLSVHTSFDDDNNDYVKDFNISYDHHDNDSFIHTQN